ncbi:MAG: penicillin-binding protein [Actinobacteria bacterium]|nr:MAG: penicillin-binding protein [Actinomycetota bacterium]
MQETTQSPIPLRPPAPPVVAGPAEVTPRRKLKKLRLAIVLLVLSILAVMSTIFGMMMAVSDELPSLENVAQFRAARNSAVYSDHGRQEIARLTDAQNRILLTSSEISPNVKNAVVAIEDRRFYQHQGVDFRGIGRAVWQDVLQQHAAQGGSTITQQFVKNALSAQRNRTVFEKLREAALAYHLERRWSKDKILTEYLNTVYFGNGAYGIEAAARTYFGGRGRRYRPTDRLAVNLTPAQAAMLAAMIASPSSYDPVQHPIEAEQRRDLVLKDMLQQHMLGQTAYTDATHQVIPTQRDINPPQLDSTQPYFSTWVAQQLVERYGAGAAFGGGLRVTTTLDPDFERAAEQGITSHLTGVGPDASAVVIDNKTGEVRAMVGGNNFERHPFNLATNGHRQPGSAIKPFILAAALSHGISPDSVWTSAPRVFKFRRRDGKIDYFGVRNFQNRYVGSRTLTDATAWSDNSVFAAVGMKVGPKRVARMATKMGIKTPVSTNPAMLLGGLKEGVTPLEMAYAYSTIANGGKRVSGTMGSSKMGPVAIEKVADPAGHTIDRDKVKAERVFSSTVGDEMRSLLHGVIVSGTGTHAQVGTWAAGKTGTTEDYGDAWFVGFTDRYTIAVWVGYADHVKSMRTEYGGAPVEGGTYPAEIWADIMSSILSIDASRHPNLAPVTTGPSAPVQTAPSTTTTPQTPTTGGGGTQNAQPQQTPQPSSPAPQQPSTPPSGGSSGGGNGGGGGGGGGGGTGGGGGKPAGGNG